MSIKKITTFLFLSFLFQTSFAQNKKEIIKVWGNCGMCQERIEKAAKKAGAKTASWDADKLELTVAYDSSKTTNQKIQQAIAKVGHDTQDFTGDNLAYSKLHGCCKYDRKSTMSSPSNK